MRMLRRLAVAALVAASGPAFAQGPAAEGAAADPAQQRAVDEAYRGRCESKTSKELCACVIAVADSQLADPHERQIFFDFMMGDVEKAKAARATLAPEKNMKFNQQLQKADVMLGDRCDRLKPKPQEQADPSKADPSKPKPQ